MKTILAAIDFSDTTACVLERAEELARATDSELHLLHVEAPEPDFAGYEAGPQHVRDGVAQSIVRHHEDMQQLRDALQSRGIKVHGHVIQGPTIEKILSEAERLNADLIVTGSHGHGAVFELLMGSVSSGIVRHARCAVLIAPSQRQIPA